MTVDLHWSVLLVAVQGCQPCIVTALFSIDALTSGCCLQQKGYVTCRLQKYTFSVFIKKLFFNNATNIGKISSATYLSFENNTHKIFLKLSSKWQKLYSNFPRKLHFSKSIIYTCYSYSSIKINKLSRNELASTTLVITMFNGYSN